MIIFSPAIKGIVSIVIFLTLLLSLITFSYSLNYYTKYNESNVKMISDFLVVHQKGVYENVSESEFNELCSKIQPSNFKEVYYSLSIWSERMLKISAIAIFTFFIYSLFRKEKINFKLAGIFLSILLISFILYFFSLDTEYDILYCLFGFSPF